MILSNTNWLFNSSKAIKSNAPPAGIGDSINWHSLAYAISTHCACNVVTLHPGIIHIGDYVVFPVSSHVLVLEGLINSYIQHFVLEV